MGLPDLVLQREFPAGDFLAYFLSLHLERDLLPLLLPSNQPPVHLSPGQEGATLTTPGPSAPLYGKNFTRIVQTFAEANICNGPFPNISSLDSFLENRFRLETLPRLCSHLSYKSEKYQTKKAFFIIIILPRINKLCSEASAASVEADLSWSCIGI